MYIYYVGSCKELIAMVACCKALQWSRGFEFNSKRGYMCVYFVFSFCPMLSCDGLIPCPRNLS